LQNGHHPTKFHLSRFLPNDVNHILILWTFPQLFCMSDLRA
jgi:hypothetical protein